MLLFIIGGFGGNLMSAVLDPCGVTVGASGAIYALYGAIIPYCIGLNFVIDGFYPF